MTACGIRIITNSASRCGTPAGQSGYSPARGNTRKGVAGSMGNMAMKRLSRAAKGANRKTRMDRWEKRSSSARDRAMAEEAKRKPGAGRDKV
ncbi:hypothetical protein BM221_007381 [Beauveria bassiana]|uniref:Uncharacterized protein n=1 Tax=Beauveria bassiana TaxID=176275 RepID=A0A2N6NGH9_BEABA|nr:hypothetical protein BM221_007381 [Beauveria bassiana]